MPELADLPAARSANAHFRERRLPVCKGLLESGGQSGQFIADFLHLPGRAEAFGFLLDAGNIFASEVPDSPYQLNCPSSKLCVVDSHRFIGLRKGAQRLALGKGLAGSESVQVGISLCEKSQYFSGEAARCSSHWILLPQFAELRIHLLQLPF